MGSITCNGAFIKKAPKNQKNPQQTNTMFSSKYITVHYLREKLLILINVYQLQSFLQDIFCTHFTTQLPETDNLVSAI